MEKNGYAMASDILAPDERETLMTVLGAVPKAGRRGLLAVPEVGQIARSAKILALLRPHLEGEPVPVRTIYFDKSAGSNWGVPWHQDLTIALRRKIETPGFGPWSLKEEIPHVQPPVHLLERMLTVRLHLDDCDEANGALQVLPGSHRAGRLSPEAIAQWRQGHRAVSCNLAAGDALLMRPLLLHASGRSTAPRHRRVLHIEYAGFCLPDGLEWHEAA